MSATIKVRRKRVLAEYDANRKFWVELHPSGSVSIRQYQRRDTQIIEAAQLIDWIKGQARLKI